MSPPPASWISKIDITANLEGVAMPRGRASGAFSAAVVSPARAGRMVVCALHRSCAGDTLDCWSSHDGPPCWDLFRRLVPFDETEQRREPDYGQVRGGSARCDFGGSLFAISGNDSFRISGGWSRTAIPGTLGAPCRAWRCWPVC